MKKKKIADFMKKNYGFSGNALEQFLHNIQDSTKSRNAVYFFKNFYRIREANRKSGTKSTGIKSKGFFTPPPAFPIIYQINMA